MITSSAGLPAASAPGEGQALASAVVSEGFDNTPSVDRAQDRVGWDLSQMAKAQSWQLAPRGSAVTAPHPADLQEAAGR